MMNKKIGFIIFSILLLGFNSLIVQLAFAQIHWDYCKVSAYGNNFDDFQTSGLLKDSNFQLLLLRQVVIFPTQLR